VGSFSEGASTFAGGGAHIFFNAEKQENKREQGGSTLAGGPAPVGPLRRYGAAKTRTYNL